MKTKNQKKPRTGGRPRKAAAEWPIYDTMAQCSAAASVPVGVLKQAKSLGCPAFRHGRIHFGEFLPWLFTTLMDDKSTDWGDELKKAQAMRERIKLAEDEARVVDRNTVADGITKSVATLFAELDRVFVSEFPSRGKGMAELDLRKLSIAEIERLKTDLRKRFGSLSV